MVNFDHEQLNNIQSSSSPSMAMCPSLSPNSNQKYMKSFISFALLTRCPTLNGYQRKGTYKMSYFASADRSSSMQLLRWLKHSCSFTQIMRIVRIRLKLKRYHKRSYSLSQIEASPFFIIILRWFIVIQS